MFKNIENKNNKLEYQVFNDKTFEDCYISFMGKEICAPLHYFGPSVRPSYLIHYILDGKGIFETEGKKYSLTKGQAFLITPNVMTYYCADKDEPWTYIWFGLKGNKVKTILDKIGANETMPILSFENTKLMNELFYKILDTSSGSIKQELNRQAYMYEFFSYLSTDNLFSLKYTEANKFIQGDYLTHAIEFIQNNYFNKIKVSDVANYIGISRNYLFTLFKTTMGYSPNEYIRYFRITRALNMLEDSTLSIENIGIHCGFIDSASFSKTFKKQYFVSPKKYRNLRSKYSNLSHVEFIRLLKKNYKG